MKRARRANASPLSAFAFTTIRTAVSKRLAEVRSCDVVAVIEIRDGTGDAQDAMHCARRQLQGIDRPFEQRLITPGKPAVRLRFSLGQHRVRFTCTRVLPRACNHNALAYSLAALPSGRIWTELGRR